METLPHMKNQTTHIHHEDFTSFSSKMKQGNLSATCDFLVFWHSSASWMQLWSHQLYWKKTGLTAADGHIYKVWLLKPNASLFSVFNKMVLKIFWGNKKSHSREVRIQSISWSTTLQRKSTRSINSHLKVYLSLSRLIPLHLLITMAANLYFPGVSSSWGL